MIIKRKNMLQIKEGFENQKAIVLPGSIQLEIEQNPLTKLLFVTDIGYYPKAKYHHRERANGSQQNILLYCTEGKGWIETDKKIKTVEKNQYVIIPADLPHQYGANNDEPWTIYWFHFTGSSSNLFTKQDVTISTLDPVENTRNDRRTRLFEELYQNLSMGYSRENLEYASVCLWYLLGSFAYLPQFERIRALQQNDMIEKSILFMHENIETQINLSELAAHCGFSVSHFCLLFKRKTSRSPIDYFNNLKIQKSCQMLDFSDLHIKEIAASLNFEDQFYFSRVFKKIMGMSPADYRKKKKG
jgi:AraC family transcriptional regulator, arabinose operon regulatory protein